MHSPGYFTSYTTEYFLYAHVVTLGHQISKKDVDKAKMPHLLLWHWVHTQPNWDSHHRAFQELDCQGFSLNLCHEFPEDRTDTYKYQYHSRCAQPQKMIASYQHAFVINILYLSFRSSLWEAFPNLFIKAALFSSHHNHKSGDFWRALSAEETSSLTELKSNHRQHGNR